jgi:hypothetical protein
MPNLPKPSEQSRIRNRPQSTRGRPERRSINVYWEHGLKRSDPHRHRQQTTATQISDTPPKKGPKWLAAGIGNSLDVGILTSSISLQSGNDRIVVRHI